jgi:glycosyltransferase involved in cell wall biosynthesis
MDLSIIVLCYGAGEAIRDLAAKTDKIAATLTDAYELILVANFAVGEPEATCGIVQQLAECNHRIKAVSLPKQGMMGWDMQSGLAAARGEYICIIDGDGQFPLESIATCYREITRGSYDLVKTYRSRRSDGIYRVVLSTVFNWLFSLLFPGLRCRDVNSKPKMMTRRAYERMTILADDWFIDAEIMLNVRRLGMSLYEFPVEFGPLAGRPSFVRFSAVLEFIKNLLRYRLMESKVRWHGK